MKKVTNITLGGMVFVIEDDAYEVLSTYIHKIEQSFSSNTEKVEILQDIENALAEKFSFAKRDATHAVRLSDVTQVIEEMGQVEDSSQEEVTTQKEEEQATPRRLYRDTDDVILAGVASGIAKYFAIDPVITRLLFVILFFANGFGLVAYLILWLIVPKAETTTQKFEMRGERVTLSEIHERIKEKIHSVEKNSSREPSTWNKLRSFLQEVFIYLGKILRVLVSALRYIIGFCAVLLGSFGIAGIVSITSIVITNEVGWLKPEIQTLITQTMQSSSGYVLLIALASVCAIPLIFVITFGSSLLKGRNLFSLKKTLVLGILWITAITLFASLFLITLPKIDTIHQQTLQENVIEP